MSLLRAAELKVGVLVLAVGSLIAFMSMQVSDDPSYLSRSKTAWFVLNNAGGLIKKSAVKSAGIPVGVIADIRLQDGRARIDITVRSDVILTTSATVEVKSQGILGDKYVEVFPGAPTDPVLPDGSQILNVKDKGSLDNLIAQVSNVTESLSEVARNLKDATSEEGTQKHILGRIVKNIEKLTGDIAQITSENKDKIGDIVDRIDKVTEEIDVALNQSGDSNLKATWKRAAAVVKNLEEITDKINRGEGTVGKLINDETTVEELNTAISGVSSMLDSANRIQTAFDIKGEYLGKAEQFKTYIGIKIQPGLDRYYYLAIVNDPAGVVETTEEAITGTTTSNTKVVKTYRSRTKITALFAKNFWDFTLRAGIIENSGGFGVDYHFLRNSMKFSFDAFDFDKAMLKAAFSVKIAYGLYLSAGYDDILNKQNKQQGYLSAGLLLTNDDLKLLLTKAPF